MAEKQDQSGIDEKMQRSCVSRRRFIAVAGIGAAGVVAGCSESDETETETDGQGTLTTTERSTTERSTTEQSTTEQSTTEQSTTEQSTKTQSEFAETLQTSPSSHIAPTDGFADADWLNEGDVNVVKVTSLAASGEGSLRWALNQSGRTLIVFEVGGVVDLEGDSLSPDKPETYVAGQTAPSPGITVIRGSIDINADEFVLQHIRVRPGDDLDEPVDGINNGGGSNVIVDHCSVSWGSDENLSTSAGPEKDRITYTNNLVSECLRDSIHPKGAHSMGTLVNDMSKRVTLAGNCWAHNVARHPRLKGGTSTVVANNLMYNFERGTNLGGGVEDETTASIVGNLYVAGPVTSTEDPVMGTTFTDASGPVRAYIASNGTEPSKMQTTTSSTQIELTTERPLWPDNLTTIGEDEVETAIHEMVGARPADRTPIDERILTDLEDRAGRPIDSQSEVGGYPELDSTERTLDVPEQGLNEWLAEYTAAVEVA